MLKMLSKELKPIYNIYEDFKKYKVEAENIEDFLTKFTKHERHLGRGKEYVKIRIKSHKEDFEKYGFTMISHHDSCTGKIVSYYGGEK